MYNPVEKKFCMCTIIIWTTNDLLAYGNLSGWSPKRYDACPICNEDATSYRIRSKICYMGHLRYLLTRYRWCKDQKIDRILKIVKLHGDDIMRQLEHL